MYFNKPELRKGSRICIVTKKGLKLDYEDATVTKIDGLNFDATTDAGRIHADMMCSGAYLFGGCWYYNLRQN